MNRDRKEQRKVGATSISHAAGMTVAPSDLLPGRPEHLSCHQEVTTTDGHGRHSHCGPPADFTGFCLTDIHIPRPQTPESFLPCSLPIPHPHLPLPSASRAKDPQQQPAQASVATQVQDPCADSHCHFHTWGYPLPACTGTPLARPSSLAFTAAHAPSADPTATEVHASYPGLPRGLWVWVWLCSSHWPSPLWHMGR